MSAAKRGKATPVVAGPAKSIDLTPLVLPRSIALIVELPPGLGRSEIEDDLLAGGFTGSYTRVEVRADRRLSATTIPRADLALISVSATRVPALVDACRRRGFRAAVVLNGPEGDIDAAAGSWKKLAAIASRSRSMAILGPNSQGVISVPNHLFAGTGSLLRNHDLRPGRVAVVTQSGLGHALVALGDAAGIGFSHIVATGNEIGVDIVDAVRWVADRSEVGIIWVITESIRRGRSLIEAGREAQRFGKTVLVWKTGHSAAGRLAARSHTGAVATEERIFQAGAIGT